MTPFHAKLKKMFIYHQLMKCGVDELTAHKAWNEYFYPMVRGIEFHMDHGGSRHDIFDLVDSIVSLLMDETDACRQTNQIQN